MPQFNDHALTEQVLESFANTPNARLKTLITELVRCGIDAQDQGTVTVAVG